MLPRMILIRQTAAAEEPIKNISRAINAGLEKALKDGALSLCDVKGKTFGIAIGSRGIDRIPDVARSVVELVRGLGACPKIFAAMGSHGGGTAGGQREMLDGLGITEDSVGAPILCCAECKCIGNLKSGYPVYVNSLVDAFDLIIPVNRVKPHTDFDGITESGIVKMLSIGIGNPEGCKNVHSISLRHGYEETIRETAAVMLDKLPVWCGLALIENWKSELTYCEFVGPGHFFERDSALLEEVKKSTIKLPVKKLDSLVIGQIGKNISGTGMDTKVVGRIMVTGQTEPEYPAIGRIVVLDISKESYGNAIGLGLADLTTEKVFKKINIGDTSLNSISSMSPEQGRIACVCKNDKEAIMASLDTLGLSKTSEAHMIFIKNTLRLDVMAVSEPLYNSRLALLESIEPLSEPRETVFDDRGNLVTFREELGLIDLH